MPCPPLVPIYKKPLPPPIPIHFSLSQPTFSMDQLPPHLLLSILTLLPSSDLARLRTVSKTLNTLSASVRTINLHFSSTSPTPPKHIFTSFLSTLLHVETISIGVLKPESDYMWCDDMVDDEDDLFLLDEDWVEWWLRRVGGGLRVVEVSDFWVQSCWRKSGVLALFSSYCQNLVELELKNAWLSVNQLKPMPSLTSLTLEFIRLDDDNLNMVNKCFPSLHVLKLIGVGGLVDPKVQLSHLRNCEWSVSNAPNSLTVIAPSLLNLNLKCVRPKSIFIDAPALSSFLFYLEGTIYLKIKETQHLRNLQIVTKDFYDLLCKLPVCKMVENLKIDTPMREIFNCITALNLESIFEIFPNTRSLILGPGAWWEAQCCFTRGESDLTRETNGLKEITAYIYPDMPEHASTFICFLVDVFSNLTNMSLLIHRGADSSDRSDLINTCLGCCPWKKMTWRWGFWSEGAEDSWVLYT